MMRARLAAMDAAVKKSVDGGSNDVDTWTTVLGRRTRTMEDTADTSMAAGGCSEKRPRSEALEIALAVDLEVGKVYAQRWNPELRPRVEAHLAAEGVGG